MGLCVGAGLLHSVAGDPEGIDHARADLRIINRVLRDHDLPAHAEPEEFPPGTSDGGGDMIGYSGLHYLRRIAVYLAQGRPLPPPGDEQAANDPVVARWYRQNDGELRAGCLGRLLGQAPVDRRFEHLLFHSDAEGYYVPLDFPRVLFDAANELPGAMLGSSVRLHAECLELAAALEIPSGLFADDDAVCAGIHLQGNGSGWHGYAIETFTCLRLLEASAVSIEQGALLCFQ